MNRWGPQVLGRGRARFALWAPDLDELTLELRGGPSLAMEREPGGWFAVEAEAAAATRYRFRLPNGLAVPDPASRAQDGGVHGWSVLSGSDYEWKATNWRGRPWREAVIYELHPGVLGGFAGVAERLPEIAELGITAVELMPIAAFSGERNWGYDGVLPYAPAESYGRPEELKALVDRAHKLGLMVYLDVVYNHFGPDGNYLGAYADEFFHQDAHTPWGAAVSVKKEPVARFFIDNALMWLNEYRFDGLRFDAVHAIADDDFLDAMARELRAATEGREIHLILENEANDPDRLSGPFDAQWNDDFHNAAHVILTGETASYYEAFADAPTEKLARTLSEGFAYQGEEIAPGRTRGAPSSHLPPTAFVNFLQNHDQVGNRALGERLTLLTRPDRLRAATALLLMSPSIPMLFMGDETGSRAPFLFFTDFHDELAEAVRKGRRQEFARFPAFSDPDARKRIPDPNDPETFARSAPQPGPDANEWRTLYRDLLALRRTEIVPRLQGAYAETCQVHGDAAIAARWRLGDGSTLEIFVNLGEGAAAFGEREEDPIYAMGDPSSGAGCTIWLSKA